MDHYIDIRVLQDPEFKTPELMNVLFSKLHQALVRLRANDIGMSFPEGREPRRDLGHIMRLHGAEVPLSRLMDTPWLNGLRDHIRVSETLPVPSSAASRRVRRVQVKSNPDRIRRRQMKRQGWTEEEARERIPDDAGRMTTLPYLICESGSTGQRFRLFIEQVAAEAPSEGDFNAYGLSATGTVPWF